jgi:hypothetical protein
MCSILLIQDQSTIVGIFLPEEVSLLPCATINVWTGDKDRDMDADLPISYKSRTVGSEKYMGAMYVHCSCSLSGLSARIGHTMSLERPILLAVGKIAVAAVYPKVLCSTHNRSC